MKKLTSPIELQKLQEKLAKKHQKDSSQIVVCGGTGCRAYGCEDVYNAFKNALEQQKSKASGEQIGLKLTGGLGFCECWLLNRGIQKDLNFRSNNRQHYLQFIFFSSILLFNSLPH